ncbi:MAG: hypothetical protein D9V45_04285 [Chloroflexi bacterium]|nr:MAG: hypothetical protein D9V45_04285 [Chloroflexota bacterium]
MSTLEQTLGISGISLLLLFSAMALIWGLMALMARIPDKKNRHEAETREPGSEAAPAAVVVPAASGMEKAKAAVLAVATALALSKRTTRLAPKPGNISTTPWQAAQRANHISRRNQVNSRKRG